MTHRCISPAQFMRLGRPILVSLWWAGLISLNAAAENPDFRYQHRNDQWEFLDNGTICNGVDKL